MGPTDILEAGPECKPQLPSLAAGRVTMGQPLLLSEPQSPRLSNGGRPLPRPFSRPSCLGFTLPPAFPDSPSLSDGPLGPHSTQLPPT